MSGFCPICNTQIEATFGMLQCPQCQSVLFIDFAGNIVAGGTDTPIDEPPPIPNETAYHFQQPDVASSHGESESEPALFEFPLEAAAEVEEHQVSFEKEDTNAGDIELTKNEYSEVRVVSPDIPETPFWDPLSQGGVNDVELLSHSSDESRKDKTDQFQSSPSGSIPFSMGSMNYKIQIKGIDSSNLRQSVLSAIRDKRLGLVSDEIAEKIEQGELTIMGLNPVKASVLMNTLKDLPFEISWELYGKEESPTE